MKKRGKKKETGFESLARLMKGESEDIRKHVQSTEKRLDARIGAVEKHLTDKIDIGFALINRRLDTIIQQQLDEHATRIKKLESAVFSR